jgi:hypothetical protein
MLPSNHPDLITCYGNISQLYEIMGEHSKALSFYEQLVHAREEILPKDQPSSTISYENIDQIYENNRRSSKMPPLSKSNLDITPEPSCDKAHRLKKFREKLEKLRKKCNK